jgi:GT2 family glycosyltransferase
VVITCYNNLEVLRRTLPKWKDQAYPVEVIVVEDGEPDSVEDTGIKEYVESLGYIYRYNDSGERYCIASARIIGIWASTKDRVLFADSDVVVKPDFVLEHAMAAEYDNITIGPRHHIDSEGNVIAKDSREDQAFDLIDKGQKIDSFEDCHGCNLSIPRAKLIQINGFDEISYDGLWGAEDTDLAFRLIKGGMKVKVVRSAVVYHIDHPTRNTGGQRDLLNRKMAEPIVRARPASWV